MRKVELLPTRDCEAGYGPAQNGNYSISGSLFLIMVRPLSNCFIRYDG